MGDLEIPIQMIVDGKHARDELVKEIYENIGPDRFILTCDESPLLFAPTGKYKIFSSQEFKVKNEGGYYYSTPLSG